MDPWQTGKMDARCRACGAGQAAGSYCYRCHAKTLDLIPHTPGQPCLASGRTGNEARFQDQNGR